MNSPTQPSDQGDPDTELLALQIAAQCWCDMETKHLAMQPLLAQAFARRLEAWIGDARRGARDAEYYRSLLMQCAEHLRPEVYVTDDGGMGSSPLLAKVPELVAALAPRPITPEMVREAEAHMPFALRHLHAERFAWLAERLNAAIANPGALCPCCNVTNLGEVMDHLLAPEPAARPLLAHGTTVEMRG